MASMTQSGAVAVRSAIDRAVPLVIGCATAAAIAVPRMLPVAIAALALTFAAATWTLIVSTRATSAGQAPEPAVEIRSAGDLARLQPAQAAFLAFAAYCNT